jgi:hypothetical protein
MTKAPFAGTAVPLSHSLGAGTAGQRPPGQDNAGTSAGVADLKTLARSVLARDSSRDAPSNDCRTASAAAGQFGQAAPEANPAVATWGHAEEERAAIVEHDSKIPREWAAGFARLDPDRPPVGVPPRGWQRFVDDCGRFVDAGWAEQAAALGWGSLDLFGCDRERPFTRIDQCGLLWLLNGARVIMLAEDAAAIETPTGAQQTWRRKPSEQGGVLAWELAQ